MQPRAASTDYVVAPAICSNSKLGRIVAAVVRAVPAPDPVAGTGLERLALLRTAKPICDFKAALARAFLPRAGIPAGGHVVMSGGTCFAAASRLEVCGGYLQDGEVGKVSTIWSSDKP